MAIEPIVVRFATAGIPEVNAAFEQTVSRAKKFEDAMSNVSANGARSRLTTAEKESREKEKVAASAAKAAEKLDRQQTKDTEREAKRRQDIIRRSSEMAGRDAVRAAREEAREIERLEEQKMRVRIRSSEMAGKAAVRAAKEEAAAVRAAQQGAAASLAAKQQASADTLDGLKKSAGSGLSHIGNTIKGVASMAAGATALAGGFEFASAFHQQAEDERGVSLLINSATSNGRVADGANRGNILGKLSQVSTETGVKRSDLIEGVQNYVALAGADQFGNAMGNAGFFAKLSASSGSSVKDITGAAGILQAQNKNLGQQDMQQMMLDIMAQGKQGAVEIKDLASLAGGLGSTRGMYQGSVTENQRKLLALAQVTRTEGTSAEEAMVAVKDLGAEAVSKSAKSTAPQWLVNAVDKKSGQIKGGPEQLIEAALIGTSGNLGALTQVFGQRGSKAFDRLAPIFNEAGGGQKGLEAVRKEMAPVMGARGSMKELDDQFATVMEAPGKKLEVAINAISTKMENAMAPALDSFAKKLSDPEVQQSLTSLITAVGKLAEFLVDNPLKGIGYIIAAKLTADIAQAAIGSAVKVVLEQALKGALAASGGGIPSVGGTGKVLGAVGAGAAAALGTMALIDMDIAGQAKAGGAQALSGSNAVINAATLNRKVKSGMVTAADLAQIQTDAAAAEKRQKDLAGGANTSIGEMMTAGIGIVTGQGKDVQEMLRLKQQENARALKEATDEVNLLKKAAEGAAAALAGVKQHAPGIPPLTTNAPAGPIGSSARAG